MKRILILVMLLALLVPGVAFAASIDLSWEPPTTNCDLSPVTDLSGYVLLWGSTSGGPYLNQHNVDDPLATSATVNVGPASGATLYFVIVSVNIYGDRSDDVGGCGYGNEIVVSFPTVPPSPPTGLTVVAQ